VTVGVADIPKISAAITSTAKARLAVEGFRCAHNTEPAEIQIETFVSGNGDSEIHALLADPESPAIRHELATVLVWSDARGVIRATVCPVMDRLSLKKCQRFRKMGEPETIEAIAEAFVNLVDERLEHKQEELAVKRARIEAAKSLEPYAERIGRLWAFSVSPAQETYPAASVSVGDEEIGTIGLHNMERMLALLDEVEFLCIPGKIRERE